MTEKKQMSSEDVVSSITGIPQDKVKQGFEKNRKSGKLITELMNNLLKNSENDDEFVKEVSSTICTMLYKFPKDVRDFILQICKETSDDFIDKSKEQVENLRKE